MPIKKCTKNGKIGYQWGHQHCYTGKGAKKRAQKQARAIYSSGWKGK